MRILLLLLALASPAAASPASYVLEPEISSVGFETDFGPDHITGKMPVLRADLVLDFDHVADCKVDVAVDVTGADASFPFAAQAMKGPKVLDAGRFPQITFVSTAVRAKGEGAEVDGILTIRGVSRPVQMQAVIWRQKGHKAGDLSHLTVRLTGAVLRSSFGATGWADMVGDQVRLDIMARIARVD